MTLPGLFLGLSLLVLFARVDVTLSLATVAIAHLVYVIALLPADRAWPRSQRLDPALEEARRGPRRERGGWCSGGSPCRRSGRSSSRASCLAFALSFDEFIITFFVIGPDSTLPLFIFSTLAAHGRSVDQRDLDACCS